MLCEPPKEDIFNKLKKIDENEYKKAILKKALDLEFDLSYIPLVAMAMTLVGVVFVNFDKENIHMKLWVVVGAIFVFIFCSFFDIWSKKSKLAKIIEEEIK